MIPESEKQWLKDTLPALSINPENSEVSGELTFTATYDGEAGFTWLVEPGQIAPGEVLTATYKIRIKPGKDADDIPTLTVEDDAIEKVLDRHFYTSGNACLCGPVEKQRFLKSGYSFIKYLDQLVVPFLYEQTYFEKYRKWPWGEYAHGAAGVFQSFANSEGTIEDVQACLQQLRKDKKWDRIRAVLSGRERVTETSKCFCTSPDQIRRCHPTAWFALLRLRSAIQKYAVRLNN